MTQQPEDMPANHNALTGSDAICKGVVVYLYPAPAGRANIHLAY